jgi:hypothetical protein
MVVKKNIPSSDFKNQAVSYDSVSGNTVRYNLDEGKVIADPDRFIFKSVFSITGIKIKNLYFDNIAADNNWVAAKEAGRSSLWAASLKSSGPSGWLSLFLPDKCGFEIQDIAYGCNDAFELATVYVLSADKAVYFSDVWSFANGWKFQKLEIMLPPDALNADSRIDATKSALFVADVNNFYGAWYDVSCSRFCFFWRHIKWKDENKWCAGSYPADNTKIRIDKQSIRAKRRFEMVSIDEEKRAVEKLYGKKFGLPPRCNFPSTVDEAGSFLSDDEKSPVDIMFTGSYDGTEGIYYGKLAWRIREGYFDTEWFFRPGPDYPLSFNKDVLKNPGTVKLGRTKVK